MGPRDGLEGYIKSHPHQDLIPGQASPLHVAIPTTPHQPTQLECKETFVSRAPANQKATVMSECQRSSNQHISTLVLHHLLLLYIPCRTHSLNHVISFVKMSWDTCVSVHVLYLQWQTIKFWNTCHHIGMVCYIRHQTKKRIL